MKSIELKDGTQERKILSHLKRHAGEWVSALDLIAYSLQYCRAIAGLRRAGHQIENRVEMHGRQRRGFYRLITAEQADTALPNKKAAVSVTGTMFTTPVTYRDPEMAR